VPVTRRSSSADSSWHGCNRLLQDAKGRLKRLQTHPLWVNAWENLKRWHAELKSAHATLPKDGRAAVKGEKEFDTRKKIISEQMRDARKAVGFSEYDLHDLSTSVRKTRCHLGSFEGLDSNTVQKLASRAFRACNEVLTLKRGKPRFKSFGQPLGSLEGKSNTSGLMFKVSDGTLRWGNLKLECVFDDNDPYHRHAFGSRTKYVRLLRQKIRGEVRYSAQLVCEGLPLQKRPSTVASGAVIGLDLGPSTLAAVGDDAAVLTPFCTELRNSAAELRRESRHLDRQRRANNPLNFTPDGQIVKGKKLLWKSSRKQKATRSRLAELHRRQAQHRKTLHGKLSNHLLTLGTVFRVEKLSVKAWQKLWGRSVSRNAPGIFLSLLHRKAERAGGVVQWINPRTAKLSQTCPCGSVQKKPLSERWHTCQQCGASAQRDLMSAWLARHQGPTTSLPCAGPEMNLWTPGAECLLSLAHGQAITQTAIAGLRIGTFGRNPQGTPRSQSGSANDVPGNQRVSALSSRPPQGGESRAVGTPAL
jgi:putative transposase